MKRFLYNQATGALSVQNGSFTLPLGDGYAGKDESRNVPNHDHLRMLGPLPRGLYSVKVAKHPRFAAPAFRLTQIAGNDHDRSGFWIHGDNETSTASSGCIVVNKPLRMLLQSFTAMGFNELVVMP